MLRVGDRLTDRDALDTGETDDVASRGRVDVIALEAGEREQLGDTRGLDSSVELADRHLVADGDPAVQHAPDGDPPQVIAGVEIRHQDRSGASGSPGASGTWVKIVSISGRRSCPAAVSSRVAVPALAFA